jgi:2,3-bisphosphoglycerate-dependent phosphoglycerate mutase
MTTYGFIRHGSTEWNQLGKLQGQLDIQLTEEGRSQAHLLGRRFNKKDWDYIVCSDLSRAHETARIIAAESGIPLLHTSAKLRERSFGLLEGTTLTDRIEQHGQDWRKLDLGVESDESVFERWTDYEHELKDKYPRSRILIVSHGSYIGTILRVLDLEEPDGYLTNTSLTIIHHDGSDWSCSLYSCTKHLD